MEIVESDICILGGGSGGLSVAAGAVQMGARVVLIEPGPMGGDCLNYGCVPSKALLAAAHHAYACQHGADFGIESFTPKVAMDQVADHIQGVIDSIAPHDSVERFENLGVKVIVARGRFIAPRRVQAGECEVRAKYFVIATGSKAMIPPIPGLSEASYFTNETIFANREPLPKLLVLGGGPIGMELAQAYRRLGSQVSVIEMQQCLAKDDADCASSVKEQFAAEGIQLFENCRVNAVCRDAQKRVVLEVRHHEKSASLSGTHLLVAAGRIPVLDDLGLDAANIGYDSRKIHVDRRLRTTNPRIFALGDVIGDYQFTHAANYQAGIVIRNMLFRLPAKVSHAAMPWVTYTDPELAHVGESEAAAIQRLGADAVRVNECTFDGNDRALTERQSAGKIKLMTDRKGRVLGVDIVGAHAGELILPWQMLLGKKRKISEMASAIAAYPTRSEISRRVAGQYFSSIIFSGRVRTIVRLLLKLP